MDNKHVDLFLCAGVCLQSWFCIQGIRQKSYKSQQNLLSTQTKTTGPMTSCCCSCHNHLVFHLLLSPTVDIALKCESCLFPPGCWFGKFHNVKVEISFVQFISSKLLCSGLIDIYQSIHRREALQVCFLQHIITDMI